MKTDNRKNNGGARENAGRKSADDPKKRIEIWVKTSVINANGGKCETKEKLLKFLENAN